MAFSPNSFLSNIKGRGGLARPNRYEVIIPIPPYVNFNVNNSFVDKLKFTLGNWADSFKIDFGSMSAVILGADPPDVQNKTSNPDTSRWLAMQCEAAELPGKRLRTQDVRIYGPGFKVPLQAEFTDINLTFLVTNNFGERMLFDRWLESIIPSDTNNPRFPKGENSRYMTNITLLQYDEQTNKIFSMQLIDAFPVAIAPQQLSWSDDGFHRITVNFAYQRYKVLYDGKKPLEPVSF